MGYGYRSRLMLVISDSPPLDTGRNPPRPSVPAELFAAAVCAGLMVLCVLVAVLAFGG